MPEETLKHSLGTQGQNRWVNAPDTASGPALASVPAPSPGPVPTSDPASAPAPDTAPNPFPAPAPVPAPASDPDPAFDPDSAPSSTPYVDIPSSVQSFNTNQVFSFLREFTNSEGGFLFQDGNVDKKEGKMSAPPPLPDLSNLK